MRDSSRRFGTVLAEQNKLADARPEFDRALAIDPTSPLLTFTSARFCSFSRTIPKPSPNCRGPSLSPRTTSSQTYN